MESLSNAPRASIPTACEGWAETKAAYRLLSNGALDPMELLACHAGKSEHRAQEHPIVLCIQDTTELDFTSQHGMYAHLTLMATPQRLALGVMDAWLWARGVAIFE